MPASGGCFAVNSQRISATHSIASEKPFKGPWGARSVKPVKSVSISVTSVITFVRRTSMSITSTRIISGLFTRCFHAGLEVLIVYVGLYAHCISTASSNLLCTIHSSKDCAREYVKYGFKGDLRLIIEMNKFHVGLA